MSSPCSRNDVSFISVRSIRPLPGPCSADGTSLQNRRWINQQAGFSSRRTRVAALEPKANISKTGPGIACFEQLVRSTRWHAAKWTTSVPSRRRTAPPVPRQAFGHRGLYSR